MATGCASRSSWLPNARSIAGRGFADERLVRGDGATELRDIDELVVAVGDFDRAGAEQIRRAPSGEGGNVRRERHHCRLDPRYRRETHCRNARTHIHRTTIAVS